ncbi:RusA family crossover junction endodeoxyribonuclease [Terrisporobacter mayombei]|uniref:RusA family crossover junction endodeoxyribonuclease n=1 Tax=Terrisporobacter mayombei TaxID=1541 RepID=UPI002659531E|nr:RusA family crossover junction endodeoxyribonuclease [Terrisporobacter mayombei]MCC3668057.1 RusA family crossover junction endodeoxyribonuclease [Terrisporobacter mayombei]
MKVKFKIPTIPVAKQRPRLGKNRSIYTPTKTKVFEEICRLAYGNRFYFEDKYIYVKILFKFEVPSSYSKKKKEQALEGKIKPTKADIDNYIKSVLDGLNGVAWRDDRYISSIYAEKIFADKSEIIVEIENVEQGDDNEI